MHYSGISITSDPESVTLYRYQYSSVQFRYDAVSVYVDMIFQPFQQNMLEWID